MIPTPGSKPKGISIGPDKASMSALGDAVAARLAMDRDFDLINPEDPAPEALVLEGAALGGMAAGWVGVYQRHRKREMKDGAPAYRHVVNPLLWIARDDEGIWRGQLESKLGQRVSQLKLMDKKCTNPTSATDEAWQFIDPETNDWEKAWTLKCRLADAAEVEAARAQLPAEPRQLSVECADLSVLSELAIGCVGVFTRGRELGETRQEQDRDVNGSPCWRNVSSPMLCMSRSLD